MRAIAIRIEFSPTEILLPQHGRSSRPAYLPKMDAEKNRVNTYHGAWACPDFILVSAAEDLHFCQQMKPFRIEIPQDQNWSCHGCTDCCRNQLLIKITPEEKDRIQKQNWTKADGVDPDDLIVAERDYLRLNHQSSGACVFLDSAGRCRIHAKHGEAAKPLACRLYPLVLTPAGGKLLVGLRFSCPSAAANQGKPLTDRAAELKKLAAEVVPKDFEEGAPPPVAQASDGEWQDFQRFVKWLDLSLSRNDVSITLKLLRTLHWVNAMEKGSLDQITGDGAEEILEVMVRNSEQKVPALPDLGAPSRFGGVFFRTMVVEHAREIKVQDMQEPGRYRRRLLFAMLRFVAASDHTPALRPGLKSVSFADIEKPFGQLSPEAEAILTRYFRVKIQGLSFCGRAFHNAPLMEGFRSLAVLYPMILWLARWHAVGEGRHSLSGQDIVRAITMADYHHGFSTWPRWRIRLLAQRNDIARLCCWYSRG